MASKLLVPIWSSSPSGASVELMEGDWVIPRLVERINHLEEQLYSQTQGEENNSTSFKDRILKIAGRSVDASLAFIAGEDAAKKHLTHEATSKALTITVNKLNSMKDQINSLEDELKAAQEEAAAARQRANKAEASLVETQATSSATLQCMEKEFEEEIERLKIEAETAKIAVVEAEQEISSLKSSLEMANIARIELEKAQIDLAEAIESASAWEERCIHAEELAITATTEAETIKSALKSARSSITHDLNATRAQLTEVQRQAEDFQRRFLAERLERRRLHEELQTLRGNIRVVCRVRPSLDPGAGGTTNSSSTHILRNKPLAVSFPMEAAIRVTASERRVSEFEFSSVLEPQSSQQEVFEEVWPALRSCLDGHNVCIFAYGQTGSGKSYTVLGSEENPGIAPRALRALFDVARKEDANSSSFLGSGKRKFSVSMLEIYMDSVRDLLVNNTNTTGNTSSSTGNSSLEVLGLGPLTQEHIAAGLERVPGRTWLPVFCADDALAALVKGSASRTTASTALNATSSRSHVILTLKLHDETTSICSMLSLVDLAGSERVTRSEAEGQQLKEAQAINKSLSALGDVVAALQAGSPHVPYRNSKLTCLLQDSLGGSSKVLLACCVAPELESAGETLSTLNFAQRAALVELGPSVSSNSTSSSSVKASVDNNGMSSSPLGNEKIYKATTFVASSPPPQVTPPPASKSRIPSPAQREMNVKTPSPMMSRSGKASPSRPQSR